MKLIIDEHAWQDIAAIVAWITKDNPRAARMMRSALLASMRRIAEFPRIGRAGLAPSTYEWVVARTPYIIVYEVRRKPALVVVRGVANGARER